MNFSTISHLPSNNFVIFLHYHSPLQNIIITCKLLIFLNSTAEIGASADSSFHCPLPSGTTVHPPPPRSLSQVQSHAAQGYVSCDTFVDKQTSEGDASAQFNLNPRNLPKIRDEELPIFFGKYPFLPESCLLLGCSEKILWKYNW